MGFSSDYSEDAREKLEEKLVDIAKGLSGLPSSTPKLKALLQKVERILLFVWQQPPESTANALAPTIRALLSDQLLQHMDPNIQMIYASCMNEITRIALPDVPYDEGEMKKIFQLFMVALKGLSNVSEGVTETVNDIRAQRILLAMSKLKTCLIMLDLECDEMVIDMFQFFFNTIKSDHPSSVFENMATVMTMMIEEMDRIPFQLVEILLSSVKLDNKDASPRSLELGKSVFEKCASRLQPRVREAVDMKNLDIKAYMDVVSSLCQDVHNGENMVVDEVVETVHSLTIDPSSEDASIMEGNSADEQKDGTGEVMHENENTLEALKCCEQIVQLKNDNTESDTPVAENSEAWPQSDIDEVSTRKRRGRKPNSLLRPEEGYLHAWAIGGQIPHKFSGDVSKEKKDLHSPSETVKEDLPSSSFGKELDSIDAASNPTGGQSQNTESEANQQIDQEMPLRRKRKTVQSNVKEGGFNTSPKRTRRRRVSGQIAPNIVKEEVNHSGNESKGEEVKQKSRRRRSICEGNTSQKHDKKDTVDKMREPSVSKPEEADEPESSTPDGHSKRSSAEYGEELVNSRIMVWWPIDKTFYTGTVVSFDSTLKHHQIIYDDDEKESLNLKYEKWELFSEDHPRQVQSLPEEEGTDRPSPAKQPSKVQRKVTRRRGGLSRKQVTSRRSRSEGRNAVKRDDRAISESGDEPSETYFS